MVCDTDLRQVDRRGSGESLRGGGELVYPMDDLGLKMVPAR